MEGMIRKALSGFYYVDDGTSLTACRGRGKLRHAKITPLVGDRVEFTPLDNGQGAIDAILPRKNQFQRPAVANIDQLVIVASQAIPVTDPFLIDRVIAIAEGNHCESIVCITKCDLASGGELAAIYEQAGFLTVQVSAETGEGLDRLRELISGKVSTFTGNSGVGKIQHFERSGARCLAGDGRCEREAGPWTAHHPPCGADPPVLRGHGGRYAGVLLL